MSHGEPVRLWTMANHTENEVHFGSARKQRNTSPLNTEKERDYLLNAAVGHVNLKTKGLDAFGNVTKEGFEKLGHPLRLAASGQTVNRNEPSGANIEANKQALSCMPA